jgi:hypothetical protein
MEGETMKTQTALIMLALLAVVAVSSSTDAQIQPNGECVAAQTWHLQQAMKVSITTEQDYHLKAAQAAKDLSTMGGSPCAGWKDWALGRAALSEP